MAEIEEDDKDGLLPKPVLSETVVALHNYFGKIFSKDSNEFEYFKELINPSQELLIEDILMAPSILEITSDIELIKHALVTCKYLTVVGDGSAVKAYVKPEQNTIILRDIPNSIAVEDIHNIFATAVGPDGRISCPPVVSARCANDHWFVTFATEEDAKVALISIRESKFDNKPIKARLKTESSTKSFYSEKSYQQNSNNNSNMNNNNIIPNVTIQPSEFPQTPPVLTTPAIFPNHMVQLPYRAPAIPGNVAIMGPSGGMFYGTYPIPPPPPYVPQNFAIPGVGMPMMGFAPTVMMAPNNNAANKPLIFNPADVAAMQHMQMGMPMGGVPPHNLIYNAGPFVVPQQPGFVDMNTMPGMGYRPQIHPVAAGGRDFNPRNNNIAMNNMNVPNNYNNNMVNNGRQYNNGNYNNSGGMRNNYSTPPYNNNNQQGNGPRQPQHLNNNARRPNYNGGNYNNNRNNNYNSNYHNNSNNNSNNSNSVNDNHNESFENNSSAVQSSETGEQDGLVASTEDAGVASTASIESQQNYNNSNEKNINNVSSHSWDNSYDRKPSYPRSGNHNAADHAIKGSWSSDNNNQGGNHHNYNKHSNQYSNNNNNSTSGFGGNYNNVPYNGNNRQHFDNSQHQTSSNNNVNNTTSDDSEGRSNPQSGRSNSRNRRTDGSNSNNAYNNSAFNKGNVTNGSLTRNKVGGNNRNNGGYASHSDGLDASNASNEKINSEGGIAATVSTDSAAAASSAGEKGTKSAAESSAAESRVSGQKGSSLRVGNKNSVTGAAVTTGGKDKRDPFNKSGRKGDRKDKKGQDSEMDKAKKVAVELNFESDFPILIDNDSEGHQVNASVRTANLGYANAVRKLANPAADPPVDDLSAAIASKASIAMNTKPKATPNRPNTAPTNPTVNTSTDLDSPPLISTPSDVTNDNTNTNIEQEAITFGAFSEPVLVSNSDAVHFGPAVNGSNPSSTHTPPCSSPKAMEATESHHNSTTNDNCLQTTTAVTSTPHEGGFDTPQRLQHHHHFDKATSPTKFGAGKSFSEIVRQQNKA
mmetsp:Transcript_30329/g.41744  ORF Transcript_30329/g.41744 Transcript_30329/m.41744 type:complete len:1036 (+) Transcript_30329:141-3248(+)